ncbi:hypothetical protein OS493_008487 [Desmophyllum pertusum]|uniref:Uncharacterized protein n=1 Tax=Desmophyllum pertusum TaxID=174260 RepID=A0A9W9ZRV2_9CNID|nr:hypothetical protein OS493_008487 [Desmophyllum pertusum]
MGLIRKEALTFIVAKKSTFKSFYKPFVKSKGKMATEEEKSGQQVDKDEGIVVSQIIITTGTKSLQTVSEMGGAKIANPCLPLGERIEQNILSLLSEETEQDLFSGTFCTRSEATLKTWFDIYQEKQMHHYQKITVAEFKLVNDDNDDTRLVNGLLTTTLCSTEL